MREQVDAVAIFTVGELAERLGGEVEMVRSCRRNRIQGFGGSTGAISEGAGLKQFDVLELPFMFKSDAEVDFVHINSPIPDHAWMSMEALKAGKHVMCTVPMATTIDECRQICELVKETGLKYMMAETVVYSREFLFIKITGIPQICLGNLIVVPDQVLAPTTNTNYRYFDHLSISACS